MNTNDFGLVRDINQYCFMAMTGFDGQYHQLDGSDEMDGMPEDELLSGIRTHEEIGREEGFTGDLNIDAVLEAVVAYRDRKLEAGDVIETVFNDLYAGEIGAKVLDDTSDD